MAYFICHFEHLFHYNYSNYPVLQDLEYLFFNDP